MRRHVLELLGEIVPHSLPQHGCQCFLPKPHLVALQDQDIPGPRGLHSPQRDLLPGHGGNNRHAGQVLSQNIGWFSQGHPLPRAAVLQALEDRLQNAASLAARSSERLPSQQVSQSAVAPRNGTLRCEIASLSPRAFADKPRACRCRGACVLRSCIVFIDCEVYAANARCVTSTPTLYKKSGHISAPFSQTIVSRSGFTRTFLK